ncbi:SGNH/GDSL hydrolase family protein [Noviherbaspirillum denitrificans]|uniref:Esterase n=1 Tax=Noviherbaspirillum denitrificans TaxID=1968433 RepID=A0A254TMM2_9BURK|nr:SGNH/GDSL hydrolase family protein [Noviherbaspirillum denitrificans]OWW22592.1 hypothetical protein AYR66_26915 [Noviherbaspirillum denitrificans]
MRHTYFAAALLSAAVLAGCGGNDTPQFSNLVSFGDSLSDVGTYAVGSVKALGGGKYTVNDPSARNWIELMATRLNVAAPCPVQTGLDGDPAQGFSVPVTTFTNCTAYAQGGARVTNPVGPGNKALGGTNAILGQLTVPVATQIQNHLNTRGGTFAGNEIVFVMAGANDVFINLATVGAGGSPTAAVTAMGTAGAELGGYVKNLVLGKGARHVVVVNVPDVSKTPFALAQSADIQSLLSTMVTTFNAQLQQGLAGTDVLLVDAYTVGREQSANPSKYGLTNVTSPACDLTPAKNPLGSSLVCTKANLAAGATDTFLYADTVHPTPLGYKLIADLVTDEMRKRGWL